MAPTPDNPRGVPANVVKYRKAEAYQFVNQLWALPWFDTAALYFQRIILTGYEHSVAADTRMLWRPGGYPTSLQLLPIAVRAADPSGNTGFDTYLEDGERYIVTASMPGIFPHHVGAVARQLCRAIGYQPPTNRDLLWASLCLLWPADSPDGLLEIVPEGPPDAFDRDTGTLRLAPDLSRPDAELTWLNRYVRGMVKQPRPSVQWTPAGRRPGSGTWADGEECRAGLVAILRALWDKGRPLKEDEAARYLRRQGGAYKKCSDRQIRRWLNTYHLAWKDLCAQATAEQ